MIEDVKKILDEKRARAHTEYTGNCWTYVYDVSNEELAMEICQLFPKSPDNPDGYEPKPNEGRLLSWERIRMVFQEQDKKGQHDNMFIMEALCQEQQELTASIMKAEYQARMERILNQMALERCDPDVMTYFEDYYWLPKSVWQALKEKE